MIRSTNTQKAERLNAAHRLLKRGTGIAEAAMALSQVFGISLRQAYRYPEEAQTMDQAVVLMEEAAYILQDGKHVIMNDFGRVEPGKDAVYGRRMTFDLPNKGGRKNVATCFTKGHLYVLEASVLPATGDFTTPDAGRFLDSLVFVLSHTEPGATELPLPN